MIMRLKIESSTRTCTSNVQVTYLLRQSRGWHVTFLLLDTANISWLIVVWQ